MSTVKPAQPLLIQDAEAVSALLAEAQATGCVAIWKGRLHLLEANAPGRDFGNFLESLGPSRGRSASQPESFSDSILGREDQEALGHAPSWIDAGSAYEALIKLDKSRPAVKVIFCLDPWSGQMRSRAGELAPKAKWVLISDLDEKLGGPESSYWSQLSQWFRSLPLHAIVSGPAWERARVSSRDLLTTRPGRGLAQGVHRVESGAWIWKTARPSSGKLLPPSTLPIVLLARYSGSLPQARVFLESITRQDYSKADIRIILLLSQAANELRYYLRWFAIAQAQLRWSILELGDDQDYGRALTAHLEEVRSGLVVIVDDYAVLPADFCKFLTTSGCQREHLIPYADMSVEASAHVVTGNLDAVAEYEKLRKAFGSNVAPGARGAIALPPAMDGQTRTRLVVETLQLAGEGEPAAVVSSSEPGRVLLRLADLE